MSGESPLLQTVVVVIVVFIVVVVAAVVDVFGDVAVVVSVQKH